MKKGLLILAGILLLLPASLEAQRNEIVRLQNDVLQLQNQIRLLQQTLEEQQGVIKSLLEQLNDQTAKTQLAVEGVVQTIRSQRADTGTAVSQLREELQTLSIKTDETNNRLAAVQRLIEENQVRGRTMRSVSAMGDPGVDGEPDELYAAAYNDYLMGNYDMAIAGFRDFLDTFPDNEYSDAAAYHLGVCYFDLGRFDQAVETFDQVINLYPDGDKVPVSYYKKAVALEQLQRNSEAVDTLRRLASLFPDTQEATLARRQLQRLGVE